MRLPALALLLVGAATAAAAQTDALCHTPAEIEAAEAIRFHTDLLVGGLACRDVAGDRDTYQEFKHFTRKHETALVRYEGVLLDRFERIYEGDPVAHLHTYRTELANELSEGAAHLPIRRYCAGQIALLDAWMPLDTATFKEYAMRRRYMEADHYRVCPNS